MIRLTRELPISGGSYLLTIGLILLVFFTIAGQRRRVPPKKPPAPTKKEVTPEVKPTPLLVPFRKGDKFGYSDLKKNIVIAPQYDSASTFRNGLAVVGMENPRRREFGYIDVNGKQITPIKYTEAGSFVASGVAWVGEYRKWGLIDKTGREITPLAYDLGDAVQSIYGRHREGPEYGYLGTFSDGLARFRQLAETTGIIDLKFYLYGFLDSSGKQVIPSANLYVFAGTFSEGLAVVYLPPAKGGHAVFIDKTGKIKPGMQYKLAGSFSDGLAWVEIGGKFGYVDKMGKQIIQPKYEDAHRFSDGVAAVYLKGKWGYIDLNGKELTAFKYDDAGYFDDGLAVVRVEGKYSFVDKSGKEITPLKYSEANSFRNGLARVCSGSPKKCGFIDTSGNEAIPLIYIDARSFSDGLAAVKKADDTVWGVWGYIDTAGKEILPFKYSYADYFSNGIAYVSRTFLEIPDASKRSKSFYVGKDGTEYYEP